MGGSFIGGGFMLMLFGSGGGAVMGSLWTVDMPLGMGLRGAAIAQH